MDQQLREAIRRTLVLKPCHVTGMHDPTHTTKRICDMQKAELLEALMAAAGLTYDDLHRKLHGPGCRSCNHVPLDEYERTQKRELYAWAGADLPEELAAPGRGAPLSGDEEAILIELRKPRAEVANMNQEGYRSSRDVVVGAARTVAGDREEIESRLFTTLRLLVRAKRVEGVSGFVRLPRDRSGEPL